MPWKDPEKKKQYQKEYASRPEVKAKQTEYYLNNKEKIKEYNSTSAVKEHQKKYNKEYYLKNKENIKEYNSISEVKEQKKQYNNKYRSKPEVKEYRREYKKEYFSRPGVKECIKKYSKEYQNNNPQIYLKSNIKVLKKYAIPFKITYLQYGYALMAWSKSVKNRDEVCQICGSTTNLNAHHIIHKKTNSELSLNLNNGITLCKLHHDEVHFSNTFKSFSALTNFFQ